MKLAIAKGTTSKRIQVFIMDSSKTDGSGLTGLVFNSAGLTAYYLRDGAASPVLISLVTATVGTWTSSGFKEISSGNMPGYYEIGIPDAALAAGAGDQVVIMVKGASNMAPVNIEIQLSALPANTIEMLDGLITAAKIAADAIGASQIADNAIDAGAIAADAIAEIQSGLAGQGQLSDVAGNVSMIKAKTDDLQFTETGDLLLVDVEAINGDTSKATYLKDALKSEFGMSLIKADVQEIDQEEAPAAYLKNALQADGEVGATIKADIRRIQAGGTDPADKANVLKNALNYRGTGESHVLADVRAVDDALEPAANLEKEFDGTGYKTSKSFPGGIVHCSYGSGNLGTAYPTGEPFKPSDTLNLAVQIAAINNAKIIHLNLAGADRSIANYFREVTIVGVDNYRQYKVIFQGQVSDSTLINLRFRFGMEDFKFSRAIRCVIADGNVDPKGSEFLDCLFEGSSSIRPLQAYRNKLTRCHFDAGTVLTMAIAGALEIVSLDNCTGVLIIQNLTNGATINLSNCPGLKVTIEANCTAGTINRYGPSPSWNDGSAGTTVNIYEGLSGLTSQGVRDAMKLAPTVGGPAVGSVDQHLDDLIAGEVLILADTDQIKSQVNTIDDGVEQIIERTDRLPDNPADELTVAGTLSEVVFKDSYNKEVLARSGAEPIQYKIGTGGNTKTINVDYETIGTVKKVKKEIVAA